MPRVEFTANLQRHVVCPPVEVRGDGGKSFDVLREGLPQTHAYDLVFRHCG